MKNWKMWELECLLYAKQPAFQRKVEQAAYEVNKFLAENKAYVAFSGGKDSTVVLSLARNVENDIMAVYDDDEWVLPETNDIIKKTNNVLTLKSKIQHCDWFTSYAAGEIVDKQLMMKKKGYHGCLIGLRAEEGGGRKMYLRKYGIVHDGSKQKNCNPLAWWTVRDVWAFIFLRKINYNKAYQVLTTLQIPFKYQRIGPFAVQSVLQYGQLSILRRGWPKLFAKFADKYPKTRNYI